jgi:hypothetical protein
VQKRTSDTIVLVSTGFLSISGGQLEVKATAGEAGRKLLMPETMPLSHTIVAFDQQFLRTTAE